MSLIERENYEITKKTRMKVFDWIIKRTTIFWIIHYHIIKGFYYFNCSGKRRVSLKIACRTSIVYILKEYINSGA